MSVHRLRNWARAFEHSAREAEQARAQLMESSHAAGYASLEAQEEIERLRAMGMADNEIKGVVTAMGISAQTYDQISGIKPSSEPKP